MRTPDWEKLNGVSSLLVMHSGGIDSLTPLYLILKETSVIVHAHHVVLSKRANATKQFEKVQEQWAWLKTNVRDFETTVSTVSKRATGRFDVELFLPEAGRILKDETSKGILTGRCSEDGTNQIASYDEYDDEFREGGSTRSYEECRVFSPVREFSKKEMAEHLPNDLLALVWGCVFPQVNGSPCGDCITCRQYEWAGIFEKVYGMKRPPTKEELERKRQLEPDKRMLLEHGPLKFLRP